MSLIQSLLKSSLESVDSEVPQSTMSLTDMNAAIDEHLMSSKDIATDMQNAIAAHELLVNNTVAAQSLDSSNADGAILAVAKESIKLSLGCEGLDSSRLTTALESASGGTGNLVYTTTNRSLDFIEEAYGVLLDKAKHLSSTVNATNADSVNCKTNKLSVKGKVDHASLTEGLKNSKTGMQDIYLKYLGGLESVLVTCYRAAIDSSKSPGWGLFKRFLLSGGWLGTPVAILFATMKRYKLAVGSLQSQIDGFIKTTESLHAVNPALGELYIKFDRDFGLRVEVDSKDANTSHSAPALTKDQIKQLCNAVSALAQAAIDNARNNRGTIKRLNDAWLTAKEADAKDNTGILSTLVRVFRSFETKQAAGFFTKRCMEPLVYGHHVHESLAALLSYCEASMKK